MKLYNGEYEFVQGGTGSYQIKKFDDVITIPKYHIYLGLVSSIQKVLVSWNISLIGQGRAWN